MHISKVSLVNYRNFPRASFHFNKGINTIIGENGSGKTNLFKAIRLLLDDSLYSQAYKLNESDFNRSLGNDDAWKGHWIIISLEFDEINAEESIQALFVHSVAPIPESEPIKKATYNLFFRPKADIRKKLSELTAGDREGLKAILKDLNIRENYETYFTGKSTADFSDPAVYKDLVGDFDTVEFSNNFDYAKYGVKINNQLSVSKEISFTFIQALRDVVSDFHNNRTNPLLGLLKNKSGEITKEEFDPISKMVRDLNNDIEKLKDVQTIRGDIRQTIKEAVGETYSPSNISIRSSLSEEADKLLQSLKLFIAEPEEEYEGAIHELSLGGANLIFLTLKLLEYTYRKSKDTFANFLIIEEPEAHIHNHIQKTLFDRLDYKDTQIIYSTHSTYISEVSNIENINILAKRRDAAEVFRPAAGLSGPNLTAVQRYLDAVRSNLLFAKGVLLVEGDAEAILLPLMVKKVLGISLDELGISLINIGSTGFENVGQLFHQNRIRRQCSIITDRDQAITDTTLTGTESDKEKRYKMKVRNSSIAGARRETELDTFTSGNTFIEAFYAEHTFEVDLIRSGNSAMVIKLLPDIYERDATRVLAEAELKSTDVSVYGKRILTIANQEKKGWFAIMLGKEVDFTTIIPTYMLEAIVFAKPSFSTTLLYNIVRYRIDTYHKHDGRTVYGPVDAVLKQYLNGEADLNAVIAQIEAVLPGDQLITFLKLL